MENASESRKFKREIAIGHGVDRIAGGFAKAESLGCHLPVDREAGTGKGRGADRALVHMFDGMAHTLAVTAEHFDISHAMMTKGDRLRRLEMSKAGHHGVGMQVRLVEKCRDQPGQRRFGADQLFLDPETEVERHLVIARTSRVQPSGNGPDQFRKSGFDVHVDVFELAREDKPAFFDL